MTAKRRWPWAALLAGSTVALAAVMLSWRAPGPAVAGTVPLGEAAAKVVAQRPLVRYARMDPVDTHPARADRLPRRVVVPPVSIRIDAIGIDAPVSPAGVDPATGGMAVPPDGGVIGWYQYGPSPGEDGASVLAGHVDYAGLPGLFFALRTVEPGAVIVVRDAGGAERPFVVQGRAEIAKADLPVAELFTRDGPPALVLVTCGGEYDRSSRSYESNVVVYATPA
jgi:hypothetical protein